MGALLGCHNFCSVTESGSAFIPLFSPQPFHAPRVVPVRIWNPYTSATPSPTVGVSSCSQPLPLGSLGSQHSLGIAFQRASPPQCSQIIPKAHRPLTPSHPIPGPSGPIHARSPHCTHVTHTHTHVGIWERNEFWMPLEVQKPISGKKSWRHFPPTSSAQGRGHFVKELFVQLT